MSIASRHAECYIDQMFTAKSKGKERGLSFVFFQFIYLMILIFLLSKFMWELPFNFTRNLYVYPMHTKVNHRCFTRLKHFHFSKTFCDEVITSVSFFYTRRYHFPNFSYVRLCVSE